MPNLFKVNSIKRSDSSLWHPFYYFITDHGLIEINLGGISYNREEDHFSRAMIPWIKKLQKGPIEEPFWRYELSEVSFEILLTHPCEKVRSWAKEKIANAD